MTHHLKISRRIAAKTAFVSALALMAACSTQVQTNPPRTATEQLLISTAADRAAAQLILPIAPGTKIFIDATNFDGTDSKYAIGAIREAVMRRGGLMVDDKKTADVAIEIRSGALSTDQDSFLIGVPSFAVPVPFASGPFTFPEIALYKNADQKGVAKFAMFGYNEKTGQLVTPPIPPAYGFSHNTQKTLLIVFGWHKTDTLPDTDFIKRTQDDIVPADEVPQSPTPLEPPPAPPPTPPAPTTPAAKPAAPAPGPKKPAVHSSSSTTGFVMLSADPTDKTAE